MTTDTMRISSDGFRLRALALWARLLQLGRRAPKRLRLCESLPLGERRFVAVVEFEAERFLVGGTPSSMVLLSRLADCSDLARKPQGELHEELEAEQKGELQERECKITARPARSGPAEDREKDREKC